MRWPPRLTAPPKAAKRLALKSREKRGRRAGPTRHRPVARKLNRFGQTSLHTFRPRHKSWPYARYRRPSTWYWVSGTILTGTWDECIEPGRYEWQTETVLVEPAHYETRLLCPLADALAEQFGPEQLLPADETKLFDAAGKAYPLPPAGEILYDANGNAYRLLVAPVVAEGARALFDGNGRRWALPPMGNILRDSKGNPWRLIVAAVRIEQVWVEARYEDSETLEWIEPLYQTHHERTQFPGHWQRDTSRFGLGIYASFDFH